MSTETPSKYRKAADYLKLHPDEIPDAWGDPSLHSAAGCLFGYVATDPCNFAFGCLSQIRGGTHIYAEWSDLEEEIRADDRIPCFGNAITIDHLNAFCEWQERIQARRDEDKVKTANLKTPAVVRYGPRRRTRS